MEKNKEIYVSSDNDKKLSKRKCGYKQAEIKQ